MLVNLLILGVVLLAGIFLACKVFAYEITPLRKVGAALCFVVLNAIPIPIPTFPILVPAVGLYVCLMDSTYQRNVVTKVFAVSYLFAAAGILMVYLPMSA